MNEENNLQEVNITALWNQNIYESIQRLQDFERICRDGAVSITEYLNITPSRMPEIQFQYLKMMISELGILLGNARARIDKGFYIKAKVRLKKMKNVVDLEPQILIFSSTNQQSHTTQNHLTEEFYDYLYAITSIREGVVVELQDILFGKAEVKAEGMQKEVGVLRK